MPIYDVYDSPTKPDSNCRSCTDFKTWSRKQIGLTKPPSKSISSESQDTSRDSDGPTRTDCPLDKDSLGQYTWGLFHTIAAVYPAQPSEQQKRDVTLFFETAARLYPCVTCARDFQQDLRANPVNTSSHAGLSKWLCDIHNLVNVRLGKPIFDCTKVDERWRDGWKDGSCD